MTTNRIDLLLLRTSGHGLLDVGGGDDPIYGDLSHGILDRGTVNATIFGEDDHGTVDGGIGIDTLDH